MAKQTINTGATANDGTGDPLRTAFTKTNENFDEVYEEKVEGPASSTDNAIPTYNGTTGKLLKDNSVTIVSDAVENFVSLKHQGGEAITWNADFKTINVDTGLGPVLQVGQEFYFIFYNDTGATVTNGTVVLPVAGAVVGSEVIPTFKKAQADSHENCDGTILVVTSDIADASVGFCTLRGRVGGLDLSSYNPGDTLWLSPTTAGAFTNVKPAFPDYSIRIGGVVNNSNPGVMAVSVTTTARETFFEAWDGSIREKISFTVTSDGATITGSLQNNDLTNDLTLVFSDGFTTLDVTPAATIALTAGTDTIPVLNYVYIPKSTKVLTVNTTGFPTDEHIKIAGLALQSAATTQTDGALGNRNWNDEVKFNNNNGHILHIAQAIRQKLFATWKSGTEGVATVVTNTDVFVSVTSGVVMQLHDQQFPSFDTQTGDVVRVVNDSVTPYTKTSNLNTLTSDANGDSLNNRTFSFVLWGLANKTGEASHLMINLPTGSYDVGGGAQGVPEADAVEDVNGYSVYNIPLEFRGVGFLIARFTFNLAGSNWQLISTEDLRGSVPNVTAGGGAGGAGVTTWLALQDTPASYIGEAGKVPVVRQTEDGLDFTSLTDELTLTAGENLAAGDLCYLSSDGKMYKTNATIEATSKGMLSVATETINTDATGLFLLNGYITTTGLTVGEEYYIDTTDGVYTTTKPSASASVVRLVGYAITTTSLRFEPSAIYLENE